MWTHVREQTQLWRWSLTVSVLQFVRTEAPLYTSQTYAGANVPMTGRETLTVVNLPWLLEIYHLVVISVSLLEDVQPLLWEVICNSLTLIYWEKQDRANTLGINNIILRDRNGPAKSTYYITISTAVYSISIVLGKWNIPKPLAFGHKLEKKFYTMINPKICSHISTLLRLTWHFFIVNEGVNGEPGDDWCTLAGGCVNGGTCYNQCDTFWCDCGEVNTLSADHIGKRCETATANGNGGYY